MEFWKVMVGHYKRTPPPLCPPMDRRHIYSNVCINLQCIKGPISSKLTHFWHRVKDFRKNFVFEQTWVHFTNWYRHFLIETKKSELDKMCKIKVVVIAYKNIIYYKSNGLK